VWKEKPLTIRGESINLFNTPQFAAPDYMLWIPASAITNTLNNGKKSPFGGQLRVLIRRYLDPPASDSRDAAGTSACAT